MPVPNIIKPQGQAYLKMLVFAPHGHGKTTFLGTAQQDPRTAPMLLLDFEGNTESLVGLDIDIAPVRTWDDFTNVYGYLLNDKHEYKSIGIDSITEVNFYAILSEMSRHSANRDEPDQAQIQDYGKVLTQMRRLLRRFRDLPMHCIYTALDDSDVEPGEGRVKVPMMIGSMKREVGALMTAVGYLAMQEDANTKEKKRVMLLHDIPRHRVKIRTPWGQSSSVPEVLDDPTIGKLMDYVFPNTKEDKND